MNTFKPSVNLFSVAILTPTVVLLLSLAQTKSLSLPPEPDLIKIAEVLEPAVVTIQSYGTLAKGGRDTSRRGVGTGSGIIVRAEGWVLTNDHVTGGASRVTVRTYDGKEYIGKVVRDSHSDLAIVKITDSHPFPVAKLGDSDTVKIGQWSLVIGSPFHYEGSLSVGVISSLNRKQEIMDSDLGRSRSYPNMIQTDAAINPGNSGGPLCNTSGEVVGINTAIESESGGSMGIGFAIPVNIARFVMKQLIENGKVRYGYLGIQPATVTPPMAEALHSTVGALVEFDPAPDSPAATAGLQIGDVIVAIGSKSIKGEQDLRSVVGQTTPGTKTKIEYYRDGDKKTLTVTIGELAIPPEPVLDTTEKISIGFEVEPITDKLAKLLDSPSKPSGLHVKFVDPNGPAAEYFEKGAVLLKMNGIEMTNLAQFQQQVDKLKPGDHIVIILMVQRARRIIILSIP